MNLLPFRRLRLDEVPDPKILEPSDAIVRLTRSAICGTDLHLVPGTMPGMVPGTVLGHEGVGVIEEVGPAVRGFTPGERVVITSTIGCGTCPTVGPATTPSATTPTRAAGPASSAAPKPPARWTACRPSTPACPSP